MNEYDNPVNARKCVQMIQGVMTGWAELVNDQVPLSPQTLHDGIMVILQSIVYLDRFLTGSTKMRHAGTDVGRVINFLVKKEDMILSLSDSNSLLTVCWPINNPNTLHVKGPALEKWNELYSDEQ